MLKWWIQQFLLRNGAIPVPYFILPFTLRIVEIYKPSVVVLESTVAVAKKCSSYFKSKSKINYVISFSKISISREISENRENYIRANYTSFNVKF